MIDIKECICDFLNNTESEEYCKLSDEDINTIANGIASDVLNDNEFNSILNDTIAWYANKYINVMWGDK